MKKHLTSSAMILALTAASATLPVSRASAGGHAGAAILGAIIGGAIVAGANNNRRNNAAHATASSSQRTEKRAIQTALNYFDFPAGTPDGVFGRRTRSAISQYQAFMGFPVTGELTDYQKEFLLSAHQRAELGGAETSRFILENPAGTQGLLVTYMEQQQGGASLGNNNGAVAASNPANDFGSPVAPQTGATGLPVFVTSQEPSMNELCISGYQPDSAEGQFCNLRAYAIDEGDRLAASVQGVSRAEIQAQCEGFAPTLAPYVSTVSLSGVEAAKADLRNWAQNSGSTPASLEGIAKVCLGVGYSTDNSAVALASLMTLVGLGEGNYDELLAYHLAMGFGFEGQDNLARGAEWLDSASMAYTSGQTPITGESGESRAIVAVSLANALRGLPTGASTNVGVVPAFGVSPATNEESGGGFFSSGGSN